MDAAVGEIVTDTDVLPAAEPNIETTQVDHREPVRQVDGNEVKLVCRLVSE